MPVISKQIITVTLSGTEVQKDTTISSVVLGNSIVMVVGLSADNTFLLNELRRAQPAVELTSSTNVRLHRGLDSGGASTVLTYTIVVLEDSDFSVQRGSNTSSSFPNTAAIASVTQTESAIFFSVCGDVGGGSGYENFCRVKFNSSTQIQIDTVSGGGSLFSSHKCWQVVSSSRWTTQQIYGVATFGATRNETITAVDLSKTFCFGWGTLNADATDINTNSSVAPRLTAATTLQFRRYATASQSQMYWAFVIQDNNASVQHSEITILTATMVDTDTISTVDQTKTFLLNSVPNSITPDGNSANATGEGDYITSSFDSSTQVRGSRSSNASFVARYVMEVVSILDSELFVDTGIFRGLFIGIQQGMRK
jgi:hypothetical protein